MNEIRKRFLLKKCEKSLDKATIGDLKIIDFKRLGSQMTELYINSTPIDDNTLMFFAEEIPEDDNKGPVRTFEYIGKDSFCMSLYNKYGSTYTLIGSGVARCRGKGGEKEVRNYMTNIASGYNRILDGLVYSGDLGGYITRFDGQAVC